NFGEHFRQLAPRIVGAASALSRLLPNLGRPGAPCRRLYAGVTRSMALYGAPIWSGALSAATKSLLRRPQRVVALRMCRAYMTVACAAACVLAGTPPWDLEAEVLAAVRTYRRGMRDRGERPAPQEVERERRLAAQRMRDRWKEGLADPPYGARTIEAIRPVLVEWVNRSHGPLSFHLVQVLTGHGCFGHYLHKVARREPSPSCHECGAADDTAQHTLELAPRVKGARLGPWLPPLRGAFPPAPPPPAPTALCRRERTPPPRLPSPDVRQQTAKCRCGAHHPGSKLFEMLPEVPVTVQHKPQIFNVGLDPNRLRLYGYVGASREPPSPTQSTKHCGLRLAQRHLEPQQFDAVDNHVRRH
ncbi:uncharacterized protein LOC113227301, partial [Hyposmocoma kahamanoa]|uniref:uncharacterized protein LOC113227301 n=1 Tax=Hyposmocoma kahamanoa TaxID=1477025 RepID=UPI000E6D7C2D